MPSRLRLRAKLEAAARRFPESKRIFEVQWRLSEKIMFSQRCYYMGYKFKTCNSNTLLWIDPYKFDCLYVNQKTGKVGWGSFISMFA